MTMKKITHYLDVTWLSISVGFMFLTVFAVLAQVFTRYLFKTPLPWTEEVSRCALVCCVYAGTVPAYVRSEHILVDFFIRMLPAQLMRLYVSLLKVISVLVVGYIAWGSYLQTIATRKMSLIALPSVSISSIYGLQFLALCSFVLVIIFSWRNIDIYLPTALEEERYD